MLIDSHAHLSSLEPPLEALLKRASDAQIEAIVNICTTSKELEIGLELSKKYPWIYNAAATTPHDVATLGDEFAFFEEHARQGHLVALGETGLDYYYERSPRELQKSFLRRYIKLAKACNLPLILHCRDAFQDLFSIFDEEGCPEKVLLHCFTGTLEEALEVTCRGWFLSLSGIVTFKKSVDLKVVAKLIALEQLLIETDTPYLAPQAHRGKQNEPSYIVETAQCIADIRGIPFEMLAQATRQNAKQFFTI